MEVTRSCDGDGCGPTSPPLRFSSGLALGLAVRFTGVGHLVTVRCEVEMLGLSVGTGAYVCGRRTGRVAFVDM
jgi:hypothetical protein